MSSSRFLRSWMPGAVQLLLLALTAGIASAESPQLVRVPVGRAAVVPSDEEVRTVAIAEPKIADAAVGSARTVLVNGKGVGKTTLVVYTQGGRYTVYDVDVFQPNSDKQVQLRVRVAELNENAKRELGFDWFGSVDDARHLNGTLTGGLFTGKVTSPSGPLGVGPGTDGALDYVRNSGDLLLQTRWKALEEKGDLRMLASPTLVARSGEKATFLAGGEFPVPIARNSGTDGVTVTIEWKQFGVQLEFTPTVDENGEINLKIAPEVSQIDFTNPLVLSGFSVPSVVTRKTSTSVHLKPHEHLVIGGLKQTESLKKVRRVPILGHVPLLGFFFTHTQTDKVERELVVVVSPELLSASATLPVLPTDERPRSK